MENELQKRIWTETQIENEFLEHLCNMNNIYNIMALCISYIYNEYENNKFDFAEFDFDKYKEEKECINEYIKDREYLGEEDAIENLREGLIELLKGKLCIDICYALVRYFDKFIYPEKPKKYVNKNIYIEYSYLNTEFKDKIAILPYYSETKCERSINKIVEKERVFRERRNPDATLFGKFLNQYIILDKEKIKQYPLKMYFLPKDSAISQKLNRKGTLTIKIVPFTNKKLENVLDIKYNLNTFEINGISGNISSLLRKRHEQTYKKMKDEYNIDFLIFPEMLIDSEMNNDYKKIENDDNAFFVFDGSKWENRANSSQIVYYDKKIQTKFDYHKKSCYNYKKNGREYIERLDLSVKTDFLIWDIEDFGRISICICCDLIEEQVKQFHMLLKTNVLFVPSYSKSMDLLSGAEMLSKDYLCIVIMANACSAIADKIENNKDKKICFVTMPGKQGTKRSCKEFYIEKEYCWENCENGECGYIINIDLNKYVIDDNGIYSFQIKNNKGGDYHEC